MRSDVIQLGPDFSFKAEGVSTQTFGILALRGAGKSNAAAVMAEEMYRLGLPFVVVDPVGSWWGLRSSGDGKTAGLQIPIFGGRHGDVPLEKTGGQVIADLVVDERVSCILDISEMSEGDKIRFLIDFAERLYRRNTKPLHLFLEEADDYCPQRPMREQARLLGAWERVVRRGRARGLGMTMITQRSASLNKNVLTQIETLFVLRTTSPQDRKAIAAWVEYQGQSKEMLESLSGLKNGEAWVWSPQWLKIIKRVQIRRRETFDSGATPKHSTDDRPAATMADVDLGKVQKLMTATIERAKQEDPRELRRQIIELRKDLAAAQKTAPAAPCGHEEQIEDLEREVTRLNVDWGGALAFLETSIGAIRRALDDIGARNAVAGSELEQLNGFIVRNRGSRIGSTGAPVKYPPGTPPGRAGRPFVPAERPPIAITPIGKRHARPDSSLEDAVPRSHRRLLDGLAWFAAFGQETVSQQALAGLCGMSWSGGAFQKYRSALKTSGYIDYRNGFLLLTEAGRAVAHFPEDTPTLSALHDSWLSVFPNSHRKILVVLIDAFPQSLSQQEVATAAGMEVSGGAFQKYRSKLKTLGAIEYVDGLLKASDLLFPEGLQ